MISIEIVFQQLNQYHQYEIQGTGEVRKLRWAGKGKGKRGGLRVIYYFYNETAPVFLLAVYGKGVQEDLTSQQKKRIASLAVHLNLPKSAYGRSSVKFLLYRAITSSS